MKLAGWLALVLCCVVVSAVFAGDGAAGKSPRLFRLAPQSADDLQALFAYGKDPLPIVSAHRGGGEGAGYPENCIPTFEHTLQHGFAMLEVDPRYTKDGVVVLLHDETLDRTTTGKGRVKDFSLPELKQLKLKDAASKVTEFSIPTLDEVFKWARGKTILVLDQKDVSTIDRAKKIEEHQAEGYALLIVSKFAEVKACYEHNPKIMMEVMISNREKVAEFDKLGVPWKNVIAFVGHTPPEDLELYKLIHERGAMCMIGTSRNLDKQFTLGKVEAITELEKDYRAFLARGADLIETDIPVALGPMLFGTEPKSPEAKVEFFDRK